jgi:hypothetical protein
MQRQKRALLAAAGLSIALFACNRTETKTADNAAPQQNSQARTNHKDPVASAMSAAPASIASGATVIQAQADGSMKTLRQGKNGWTCMPDSPTTPGPDPMCMDSNGLKWAQAWMGHKAPPANVVGLMYMLEGGTDASNTDPYAQGPTQGNAWIETGPHVMIVGSKDILAGHPSGAKPDTSAPFVMWAGTPYAHLMVPVAKPAAG